VQERLFSTWHQLEQDLYDADDAGGRAGYRRVWPTLRKACEAAGIDPIELDANRFGELADSKRWSPRTRCLLLKVARYAGLDVARSETLEPADVDPSLTAPLRRLAMRPASAPEVRNTFIAGLVWQWPASCQRLRVLEVAHLTPAGGDLLLSTGDAAARRLQGLFEHYSAWRDARAAVGVDDAPMLFCAASLPP